MNWISITKATLYDAKVAALVDACDTAAIGAGQTNRTDGIIQNAVDDIRRKVASCRRNTLDSDTTKIPKGLKQVAMDLILARLKIALEMPLTDDERSNLAKAERDLNRVADCSDVVDQPDDPIAAPMEPGVGNPSFGDRTRNFTDTTQDG